MLVSIELSPQAAARLHQQASAAGKNVESYLTQIVEQAASKPSLDEILTPMREHFDASGISQEELIADITEAQAEYRAQQRKKTA